MPKKMAESKILALLYIFKKNKQSVGYKDNWCMIFRFITPNLLKNFELNVLVQGLTESNLFKKK